MSPKLFPTAAGGTMTDKKKGKDKAKDKDKEKFLIVASIISGKPL